MGHSHHTDHKDIENTHQSDCRNSPHRHSHSDLNMKGLLLHVAVDTLGSVGVLLSSFLIQRFGWRLADPLCSLAMAVFIVAAALPLLRESAELLLQRLPAETERELVRCLGLVRLNENTFLLLRLIFAIDFLVFYTFCASSY